MIDALIGGKLHGKPIARTGSSGKPFVTAKVRVPTDGGEAIFASVIAFVSTVRDALLELDDGDPVALAGALTPKVWTDRDGQAHPALDLVAHAITTPYHVRRKREAVEGKETYV